MIQHMLFKFIGKNHSTPTLCEKMSTFICKGLFISSHKSLRLTVLSSNTLVGLFTFVTCCHCYAESLSIHHDQITSLTSRLRPSRDPRH